MPDGVPRPSPHHTGCERGSPGKIWPLSAHRSQFHSNRAPVACGMGARHRARPVPGEEVLYAERTSCGDEFQRIPTAPCQFPSADRGHGSCTYRRAPGAIHSSSLLPPRRHTHIRMAKPPQRVLTSGLFGSPRAYAHCCQPPCCPAWRQIKTSAVLRLFQTVLSVDLRAECLCRMPIRGISSPVPLLNQTLDTWQEQTRL